MKAAVYSRHRADLICNPGSSRITSNPYLIGKGRFADHTTTETTMSG
jgi:hypothetical protein